MITVPSYKRRINFRIDIFHNCCYWKYLAYQLVPFHFTVNITSNPSTLYLYLIVQNHMILWVIDSHWDPFLYKLVQLYYLSPLANYLYFLDNRILTIYLSSNLRADKTYHLLTIVQLIEYNCFTAILDCHDI